MTADRGAHFYRMQLPLGELAEHDGFEVAFASAGDQDTLSAPGTAAPAAAVQRVPMVTLRDLQGFDAIVAQRWNRHEGLEVWRRARTPFSRLVYELDDDVFHVTPDNWAAYKLYGRPDIRDAIEHSAEVADLVTVSTEPLAEVMREFNPNVAVLPNCIPRWATELPHTLHPRPRAGWMGGASHGVDIGIVAEPVRRFLRRFPSWDFQCNATDYRPTIKAPAGRMFYQPWVQVNTDPEGFYGSINFDIGLCPLYPTTFSRAKSGLKALEYAARGIPSIATDCPAYREVITHGVNGFLVKRDHEWLAYLSELAGDDELREKMGEAAQDMARQHTIEEHWTRWAAAYEGLFPAR